MKRELLVCLALVAVVPVFATLIYMSTVTTYLILEITHLQVNPDNSFTVTVKNNLPIPENGFTPPSERWKYGTIIVYDTNSRIIYTVSGGETRPPSSQQTKSMTIYMKRATPDGRQIIIPLETGMGVILLGLTETGQEIYSNKAVYG